MATPYNIRRVIRKLRMYHTRAPEVKGEFNVFRRVEHLIKISKDHNSKFPFDFDWIMQMMHGVEEALLKDPYAPTPCHCDLLNLNFLDEETPGRDRGDQDPRLGIRRHGRHLLRPGQLLPPSPLQR